VSLTRTRTLAVFLTVALAASVAGCAGGDKPKVVKEGKTEGISVDAGPLTYQVQISRQLNPVDIEDRYYLKGVSASDRELRVCVPNASGETTADNAERSNGTYNCPVTDSEVWFAVFIRVSNEGDDAAQAASDFEVKDTVGKPYRPIKLGAENDFAYRPKELGGGGLIPVADSVASDGVIQGSLLLFKVTVGSLANRPLQLIIKSAESPQEEATVDLDV
jgi:hypothetical protein